MLDSEKIELISEILKEFWMYEVITEDSTVATLNAIAVIVDFKRNGKE